ncbi:MAG TPA: hypothetical protein DET40_09950 [Lentisphaeria bacterium]|nr:MAG: hypothetical protein A2X45_08735 [Lentisphaerae bacterium GWF2_50_93]HCE43858.1 hypothetical protein [Lentisphaeria bacterium]
MGKYMSIVALLVMTSLPAVFADQFEDIKNSMVILDTGSGKKSGILVKFDGITYVMTSQDAFSGNLVSMKTISGKMLQPQSFEVPEEPIGLLRIKTDFAVPKDVVIEDKKGGAEVYRTDPKMGIIAEQNVNIDASNALRFPDENGAPLPFAEDAIGSPVFSKDGKLIGIAGCNGYAVQNCNWVWGDLNRDLSNRRNELQPIRQVKMWKKVDQTQFFRQGSMIDDAENFLFPYTSIIDAWCKDPYGIIAFTPEQPDKMKAWLETHNTMVKGIPVIRKRVQDGFKKMGDTAKNVAAGQLRDQCKTLGKRITDFAPFHHKTLSSPNIKWESSYFKKKAEDISSIYKNLSEGLRREAENAAKVNPPL